MLDTATLAGDTRANDGANDGAPGPSAAGGRRRMVLMLAGGGVAHTSGGVGTLLLYLADAWADRPDAPPVRVVDTRGQGGAAAGAAAFVRAVFVLLRLGLSGRLLLAHVHMATRGSAVRKCLLCAAANLIGVPTIVHQHGADFQDFFRRQPAPFRWAIRGALNRSRRVVVLGEAWREFVVREVGVRPEKVVVSANGVARPASPPAAPRPGGPARILFLGRIGERKGVPELLDALARPRLRERAWVATVAGDGEVERFRREADRLGLADRVEVPGWLDRDATAAALREADMLALPSHHEAMPIAVLEALAHRVAVVTTPVGAVPEFLADGVNALLVPPGDPDALADALVRLLADEGERARLAAAGHGVFLDRFEIGAVADGILALYREVGTAPRPGRGEGG